MGNKKPETITIKVIRPSNYKYYCARCPFPDKRAEEVIAHPALLSDPNDDFSVTRLVITCEIDSGPETNVYMSDVQHGTVSFGEGEPWPQNRPGKLEKVMCPRWEFQRR